MCRVAPETRRQNGASEVIEHVMDDTGLVSWIGRQIRSQGIWASESRLNVHSTFSGQIVVSNANLSLKSWMHLGTIVKD